MRMSLQEFVLQIAANAVEPLPDPWYQTGTVAASIWNSQRTGGRVSKPEDFIPHARKAPSVGVQKAQWRAYIRAHKKKRHGRRDPR